MLSKISNNIKLFFLLLALQILTPMEVNGQTIDIIKNLTDSLTSVSSEYKKVDLYNQLSEEYIKRNTDTFYIFYAKAINLSKKINYKKGFATAYDNRSRLYFYLDSFQLALIFNDLSYSLFKSLNDSSKLAKLHYFRGDTYYYLANYDSAVSYYKNSLDLSKIIQDTAQMAISLKQIGKMHWLKGDLTESLKNYEQALIFAKKNNNTSLKCILYNNIGTIFYGVGDYEEALKYYYLTLPLRDSLKDYKGKSLTLNNIGMIFSEWGKHNEAYNYYSHAASLCDSLDYNYGKAYSYYNLGNHLLNYNNIDSSVLYFKKAIETYAKDNNNIRGMYICYSKLGKIFQEQNKPDSALKYFEKALYVAKRMGSKNYEAGSYSNIANQHLLAGNIDSALQYAFKAYDYLSKTAGYKKMKQDNYQLLASIYEKKRNFKKALKYNRLSSNYKDSIFNEEKTKQITRMEVLYRIEQKNKENEYLKKEQERQKAKLEADRLTIRLQYYLVAVVSLLLVMVVGFTFVFYKEKQKLKAANNTKNKLFSIISHDLRGPLGNFKGLIDLLLLDFANNDREKMNSLLKMMQKTAGLNYDLLENLLSWSRTESQRLDFQPEKIKLYPIINSIFEHYDYSALTKSVKLINKIDEQLCIYADEYMINTILRNLISNALKFTNTNGKIIVSSKTKDNSIEITVEDNGIGMSPEIIEKIFVKEKFFTTRGTAKEKGTGLGLKLCKEFVKIHNGEIVVNSQLNNGTKISFTISKCTD